MLKDNGQFIKFLYGKYAIPSVLALLAAMASSFINTLMAGSLFGGEGLEVVGFFMPVFFVFSTVGALIGAGAANGSNKAVGEDDFKKVSSLFSLSTVLCVIAWVSLFAVCCIFSTQIIGMLTGAEEISSSMRRYFIYTALGGAFTMYIYIPLNFSKLDGKPNVSVYMFMAMITVNLAANFVLIFVFKQGVEALAAGAALGGLGSVVVGLVCMFCRGGHVYFTKPYELKESIQSIFVLGGPMALNNFYNFLRIILLNLLFVYIGEPQAVGIFAVINTISSIVLAIASGLGQALVLPTAVFNNKYDSESVRILVRQAFIIGNIAFAVLAIAIVSLNKYVCHSFSIDSVQLMDSSRLAIILFGLSLVFVVNNLMMSFYYTAIYRIGLANTINFLKGIFFVCVFAAVLAPIVGSMGVWVALLLSEICTLFATMFWAKHLSNRAKKNGEERSFPLLIDTIYETKKQYLAFSVKGEDQDVSEASEQTYKFCESIGVDMEETMFISMAVEEIIMFIKTERTELRQSGKSMKDISVRIYLTEQASTMNFMYQGETFNPIEHFQREIADDFEKSLDFMGIKYLINRAEKITFSETFGVNHLSIFL